MRIALIAIIALLLVPTALAAGTPRVHLADRAPATVAGTGFRHAERVLVTVSNGKVKLSKRVLTNGRGTFTARFAHDLPMAGCGQIAITAAGSQGERVSWKTPPQVCGAQPPVLQ
ncbi:MAG TPA: hypothetical protein VGU02_04575 [Gaiellaceae bacterium]|nr:hypothetical protein [Gaiellaceae bacterium]